MKGWEEGKAEEGRVPFLFLTSSPGLTEQMKPLETRNNVRVKFSRARLGSEVFLHPLRVRRSRAPELCQLSPRESSNAAWAVTYRSIPSHFQHRDRRDA